MRLFGFEIHNCEDPWADATPREIEVREMLRHILENQEIEMATLDDVIANVAAEDTVIDGAVDAINGMQALIASLKTTQTDPATAAKIDALNAEITAKKAKLAAAFVVATPVPPAPPAGGTPVTVPGTPAPQAAPVVTPAAADTAATAAVAANPPTT